MTTIDDLPTADARNDERIGIGRISYTPIEAALATGRSRSRIFKAVKGKELVARKDGRATLIEDDELRRWVRSFPIAGVARNALAAARPDNTRQLEDQRPSLRRKIRGRQRREMANARAV